MKCSKVRSLIQNSDKKYFNSLYNFYYRDNGPADLRNKIENNQLKDAFHLLKEIDGVGEKIAKFMVRDLVFHLTDWGMSVKMDSLPVSQPEELEFAIPVDIWVRRIAFSIPSLRLTIFRILEDDPLNENGEVLNRVISKAIVKVCLNLRLNPLKFDIGAYLVGKKLGDSGEWDKMGGKKFPGHINVSWKTALTTSEKSRQKLIILDFLSFYNR